MGLASVEFEKGREFYLAGQYQAAIDSFKEALEHHGGVSGTLENWLGNSYAALGEHDVAIVQYSNAVDAGGDTFDLLNRALAYFDTSQCEAAIKDAQKVLTLTPISRPGFHSDAEANAILGNCYAAAGKGRLALQHTEASIRLAEANGYSDADLVGIKELKDWLRDR